MTKVRYERAKEYINNMIDVRKYLEEQCGYKTKWYHKLFWKGRKYF